MSPRMVGAPTVPLPLSEEEKKAQAKRGQFADE